MTSFLLTFLVIAVVIAIMSVGVLFGRRPVQGSCGGLNKVDGLGECELCKDKPCPEKTRDARLIQRSSKQSSNSTARQN